MINREVLRRRGVDKEEIRRFSLKDENKEGKVHNSPMVTWRYAGVTARRKGALTCTRKFSG